MAHVIANLLGRCICIRSKEELYHASPSKQLASASLILSWYLCQAIRLFSNNNASERISFYLHIHWHNLWLWTRIMLGFTLTLLISGTLSNSKSRRDCGIAHHHLLYVGGVFCFFHGIFLVAYYLSATVFGREQLSQHESHENKQNRLGAEAWPFQLHSTHRQKGSRFQICLREPTFAFPPPLEVSPDEFFTFGKLELSWCFCKQTFNIRTFLSLKTLGPWLAMNSMELHFPIFIIVWWQILTMELVFQVPAPVFLEFQFLWVW